MGREVPRNGRRSIPPRDRNPPRDHNPPRENYQRRGTPYEVGQSYRYMPEFREPADPYFSQKYDNRGRRGGGYRGGRDIPGYFPASRRPQRPEQLMNEFDYTGGSG